jgi:hypothetical protein
MVNWREDVEFFYALFMLVSAIVIFFYLYDTQGLQFAGIAVGITVLVEAGICFIAFESDRAIANWEKLEKDHPKK